MFIVSGLVTQLQEICEHASIAIIGVSHDVEGTRHCRQALDGSERAGRALLSKWLCMSTGWRSRCQEEQHTQRVPTSDGALLSEHQSG